jgi:hypothetical protein
VLQVQWSEVLACQVDLTRELREILFESLTANDIDIPMNYLKLSVQEILELREKADKGSQILTLLPRTREALVKKAPIKQKMKTSLTVILDVLRMRKFVVRWPHMKYESEKTTS